MALRCGKVLVTGGSQGAGFAIAQRLCEEGALVTITAKHKVNLDAALELLPKGQAFGLLMDIEDTDRFASVCESAAAMMNGLDCLINNAGSPPNPFLEVGFGVFDTTEETWGKVLDKNLRGSFFMAKTFVWHLLNHNQMFGSSEVRYLGDIINISSDLTMIEGAYSIAESGVNALTETWARWLEKYGIIVNGVAGRQSDSARGSTVYHLRDMNTEGRFDTGDEVAGVVAFLLQESSINIQGQTIICNGKYQY